MSQQIDFYMEPVRFYSDPMFLSGATSALPKYDFIKDKEEALKLLFSQDIPSGYLVWEDFFSTLVSELIIDNNYNSAQKKIMEKLKENKDDDLKSNIRKRKEYLLRKKMGLAGNDLYDDFVKDVGDECYYILTMVSTQRYLYKMRIESKLEELFDIIKYGLLPCGVKKNTKEIVVYNPLLLKGS